MIISIFLKISNFASLKFVKFVKAVDFKNQLSFKICFLCISVQLWRGGGVIYKISSEVGLYLDWVTKKLKIKCTFEFT